MIRLAEHMPRMTEIEIHIEFWWDVIKGRNHLADPNVDGCIRLPDLTNTDNNDMKLIQNTVQM
jgi:hypothetical protein